MRKEINYDVNPNIFYPQLFFTLYLQRKPHYYMLHILLPCVFITLIALLVSING